MNDQIIMVSLEDLVPQDHVYRKFSSIWQFDGINKHLKKVEKSCNYKGFGIIRLFKCLLLQFLEDLSDRELERYLKENTSGKWFCGFGLTEETPSNTTFSKLRDRIGTKLLSEIFRVCCKPKNRPKIVFVKSFSYRGYVFWCVRAREGKEQREQDVRHQKI